MPFGRDRLYLALYARGGRSKMQGGEDAYFWAFIVGPKSEGAGAARPTRGTRFAARQILERVDAGAIGSDSDSSSDSSSSSTIVVRPRWVFEECQVIVAPESMILVRLLVGKVQDMARLRRAFRNTPVPQDVSVGCGCGGDGGKGLGGEDWNWVAWARAALGEASRDGRALGRSAVTEWEALRGKAMEYVEAKKAAHRFDGTADFTLEGIPTWDMIRGLETWP
ncbi:hypothetical protein N3K66_007528 [Trichothecium roseum]|uniref:Uncharacterized protein n=1 Tax=Trichothecium roseum TaxID=47278 RepID=A0ACC0UVY4_9HYPO|nr:hypothetical protein N3K66_007528 [Trichothecium roseum]